ncbi:MAG: hypothetical protein ACRD92_02610 [Nitrosopumilaceae archaeon]
MTKTEVELSTNYIPSDMSKAFPELDNVLEGGDSTILTTNIEDVKNQVQYTLRGTVVNIGELEEWIDPTPQTEELQKIMGKNVKFPVDIEVTQVRKAKSDLKVGEIFTVNVLGRLIDNTLYLNPNSPQFEVGEDVIVHVSIDPNDIIEKDFKFVQLGEYGKYKIQDGMAFNAKYPHGRDLVKALDESQ